MSRNHRTSSKRKATGKVAGHAAPARNRLGVLLKVGAAVVLCGVGFFVVRGVQHQPVPVTPNGSVSRTIRAEHFVPAQRRADSWEQLVAMTEEELAQVDVAEMNLLCAVGLPGAEDLDIDACMKQIDEWLPTIQWETERHLYRATDPKHAEHYKHSENYVRAEFLTQTMQTEFGVHYNLERVRDIDFTNSKDLFIHGMINDPNGGTCASMPALYVAVGRRLGYPLKLSLTIGHVFVRWDGVDETFNVEVSGNGGTDSFSDEYYTTWPQKMPESIRKEGIYLKSLTPREMLAGFLANRGHCLLDIGRTAEAKVAYDAAMKLAPNYPGYRSWASIAGRRLAGLPDYPIAPPTYSQRGNPMAEMEDRIIAESRARYDRMIGAPISPAPRADPLGPYRP